MFDDAIVGIDADGVITHWNASAETIFGYAGSDVLGRTFAILAEPGQADELADLLRQVGRAGGAFHAEHRLRHCDGTERTVMLVAATVNDRRRRQSGIFLLMRDMTAHRRMVMELETTPETASTRQEQMAQLLTADGDGSDDGRAGA